MRRWSSVHLNLLNTGDSHYLCYWHELLQQLWDLLSPNWIYFHAAVWALYQILQMCFINNGLDFVQAFLKWLNNFWIYNWMTMFYHFLQILRDPCLSEEPCNNASVCKAALWCSQVFFWEYPQWLSSRSSDCSITLFQDIDWVQTEKHVFEQASSNPFLVGLHSCFQTTSR